MSLQEKFQITIPPTKPEEGHEWATFGAARKTGEAGFLHSNNSYADADSLTKTNFLPPGMDISNQKRTNINTMPRSIAGATDVTDNVTPEIMRRGFARLGMNGDDDQYTGEHMDHFYGEAVDEEGHVGFVERNNYLDRE